MADTSTEVRERAGETASTAVDQSKEMGRSAREAGGDLVDDARDQVGTVATELRDQARQLVDDTRSQLQSQADGQRSQLAEALSAFGGELRALVDGRSEEAGTAGRYVEQVGGAVDEFASQIRERDFAGIVDDVQRFARRRPGIFLAAVAATGFVAGRMARSTTDDRARPDASDAGAPSPAPDTAPAAAPVTAPAPAPAPAAVATPDGPVGPDLGGTGTAVP